MIRSCKLLSYICVYINATENIVMLQLYLGYDFDIIIFEIEHKLYLASGSAPLNKNCGCAPESKWPITLIPFALQQVYDTYCYCPWKICLSYEEQWFGRCDAFSSE
jgi:hypothetical protein